MTDSGLIIVHKMEDKYYFELSYLLKEFIKVDERSLSLQPAIAPHQHLLHN
ncbi:DUF5118 domain-containing protein [candidate division KSB1 bacterium]|nr:DUF5118 domain-containing protein [candidate division KSB1 bacterium]